MSYFYGTLKGTRGEATRCGSKSSGMTVQAAGWRGAIRVELSERDGVDYYRVTLTPWQSSGGASRVLAEGRLDAAHSASAKVRP